MAEEEVEHILVSERRGSVQVLRLNRPDARNALNPELIAKLGLGLIEAEENPDILVVVLTGTGDRAFCAGMASVPSQEVRAPQRLTRKE
jgi:enoyl-CoA hydratase/carnithine racemase